MNYTNPKLQSMLAAEYVLGSLQGQARRRFDKLLFTEPGMRDAVEYWQYRLNPLAETVAPVQPSRQVWENIQSRILKTPEKKTNLLSRWFNNLDFWRGVSLASVMMAVGFYLVSAQQPSAGFIPKPEYVAILSDTQAKPSLVASMVDDNSGGKALKLEMLGPDATDEDHVMQVWCVPKEGGQPMSIGLLTEGEESFQLSIDQLENLHEAAEITITFEPIQQSPMPEPSGQVMYRGKMI